MTRGLTRVAAGFAAALAASFAVLAGAAYGADDATIDHTELTKAGLQLLVTVPGDNDVDLGSVKVTIDGQPTDATAALAATQSEVKRTTVLAIDTSGSMKGERIAAAKAAALTYLDTVPANVKVGIVTFSNTVDVRQPPSLDRDASKALINGLTLTSNTALYQGVTAAIDATGTDEGLHQVLVLSDGEDSTKTTLPPVISAIKKSKVKLDVVSLEQGAQAPAALQQMADAGGGKVIAADSASLEDAFSSEADALARQIAVTATVPADQQAKDATVEVSLDSGGTTHSASGFFVVKDSTAPTTKPVDNSKIIPADSNSLNIPKPVVYGALGAIGLGALGLIGALIGSSKPEKRASISEQMQVYSASAETSRVSKAQVQAQVEQVSLGAQARAAAENVLASNTTFEARIADKLEGAGMALKSSEWLLLHIGIAFFAAMLGLLLSGGNPFAMLLLLLLGAIGPWVYLTIKQSRRLAAFDAGLADTLQLMSGSLSAGLSLAQSMDTIVREGVEPITGEFRRVIVESRLGVPLEDALEGIAIRMQSQDFKWVVMAIRIQREVGGNLAELLNNVANTLREREYIRRHVRALSAEGRLSCWILGGLPPGFLIYLSLTKPDYVNPMYTTPIGWLMCAGMAILLSVGIFWMTKVAKVEV
ncbi:type II secretion system F family protein [Nocardioides marmorisolisilvae]|uniref:VWA domain-containing protein n=1 Tax=Nocardioides marmorisolisilvae TaxID=1542737 RepID=A0A3N0DTX6_9ACTN|nr:type II secretion system F family protein [Nocardioides marmorisolisilvae]RNL79085.1 VWA domain-containing protein [Nocardioides marmorisolisilvae]